MIVTYIYNSCYLIEFDRFSVLLDFYKDVRRPDGSYWIADYLLNKKEDLYVLSSHSHSDHFIPDILSWKDKKDNITYIFSREILKSKMATINDASYLDKGDVFVNSDLKVKCYGSTDTGGSFLLTCENKHIFHAGDLNNWHWRDEVTKEEALSFENNYLCELELIAEDIEKVYLTMFPVDPRLGNYYMLGAKQFVGRIQTDYFLPMHFGDNYDKANEFARFQREMNFKYLPVTYPGQSFTL